MRQAGLLAQTIITSSENVISIVYTPVRIHLTLLLEPSLGSASTQIKLSHAKPSFKTMNSPTSVARSNSVRSHLSNLPHCCLQPRSSLGSLVQKSQGDSLVGTVYRSDV